MKVLGHEKQKEILKKMAASGKIPHALLFSGPEKIGKKKLAKEFVKLLNCEKSSACGKCTACNQIESGEYPDLFLIESEDEIKIGEIRELQKRLSLTGRKKNFFKTAIIDNAHLLNSQAQSCLLKTLEEPKGKTLIILITQHPKMLLDTILSRVGEIKLSPVGSDLIRKEIERRGVDKKEAERVVKIASSKPGLAFKIIEGDEEFKKKWLKMSRDLNKLKKADLKERFDYVGEMSEDGDGAKETLKIWLSVLREEMIKSENGKESERLRKSLKVMEETLFLISKTNVNLKLALERVIINL